MNFLEALIYGAIGAVTYALLGKLLFRWRRAKMLDRGEAGDWWQSGHMVYTKGTAEPKSDEKEVVDE